MSEKRLHELSVEIGSELKAQGLWITCAESCTGGLIAKAITDIAGSSAWFDRGFVTYSNAAKHELLGVSEATLEQYGAVSEQVVREMAQGVLHAAGADIGLSVSGIAGPDGGSPAKPVGTVCFGWAIRPPAGTGQDAGPIVEVVTRRFEGSRRAVRFGTAWFALAEGLARWQRALEDRPPTA